MSPGSPPSRAGLALTAIALLTSILPAGCTRVAGSIYPAGSNILLITVDTLRADHLSSYGYPRNTSPHIDRLAAEGVRFDQAAVQWPKTGPSFASIFTSTYPKDNGIVRKIGTPIPHEFKMLAEVLSQQGYSTHAVVSNGAVAREFNFDQGFDSYRETWKPPPEGGGSTSNHAAVVNQLTQAVVAGMDRSRPFFLWVHYLDPHFPYAPPQESRNRFQSDDWYDPSRKLAVSEERRRRQLGGIGYLQRLSGSDELDFYVARYDAEIAYTDDKIGQLLEFLNTKGLLDKTLTVVTSDHGESLGEHSYFFDHGRFSFQTCLRVPLILHYPGVLPPRVDGKPVELIHLSATLLETAGVPLQDGVWMQGRSLTPRLLGLEAGGAGRSSYAYSEAGYATKRRWQKIVRDERYKLIYAPFEPDQRWIGGRRGAYFALFDLLQDPQETVNLADREPEVVERLSRELTGWWRPNQFNVRVDASVSEEVREMAPETREQLEALGYLQ